MHISYDDGLTWQGTTIDWPSGFNGDIFEVEPDIILCVYMNEWGTGAEEKGMLRMQRVHITSTGPEPDLLSLKLRRKKI
jgi:hypothetical protein